MAEKGALHPISKEDLEQHITKANEHMESINRGGIERPSLFDLVRDVGGDKHMMAKEVQDTLETMRQGFSLYYEMYATLEDRAREIDGKIDKRERISFLGSYSMFAAGSYIAHKLDLSLGDQETIEIGKKEGLFTFDLKKDDVLNNILSKYYGLINTGKRNKQIKQGSDLPKISVEFFRFLRDEALAKKQTFNKELVDLIKEAEFRIADEFTIAGFEASYEEEQAKTKVEFVPMYPHQVAGNVLAKKEILRDMDRIVLFDPIIKKNPILEVGGLSWSVLYDGLPGTGKSSLFRMGLTRLNQRCEQVSEFWKSKNLGQLKWKQLIVDQGIKDEFYGKTGKNLLNILDQAKKTDGIYIITTDDIDHLVSKDRSSSTGGADKDILNVLMQYADGINTIISGNVQWWAATNDATSMDPALRQRFIARYSVDGPQEWYDFSDIIYNKLKNWIDLGIIDLKKDSSYKPYEMRKSQIGYEKETNLLSEVKSKFSRKKDISLRDIGELCQEMKQQNPRFTGRAVHAVSEAIKKRVNDYEIPEEWYENPEAFFFKDYQTRVDMLKERCMKTSGQDVVQEFERYFKSEQRYASDKFDSDVERTIHNIRVQ